MALMMFFAGCQDPLSDYSVTNTNNDVLPEIAGPEWVKAEALAGANRIIWALNKDAKGYAVYRQKVDAAGAGLSGFVQIAPTSSPPFTGGEYIDAVSIENQLENGALYKYGVVAYTDASLAGRSVVDYVKDGVTYADPVTANIPAQGTVVTVLTDPALTTPALTDANITAVAVQGEDGDELLVSWRSPHPVFSYAVKYALGNATLAADITSFANSNVVGDPVKYFHTPLFGGTTQISLGVMFKDQYYYKPALITKAVTGLTLSEPLSITPDILEVTYSATGYAVIKWNLTSSLTRSDYKLYRIETKGVYQNSNTQIEVVGDWTAVTGISDTSSSGGSTTVTVTDSGLDPTKNYLYALYAEVGGRKSAPALKGLAAQTVSVTALAFDIETSYTTAADDTRTYSATIGWNAAEGVTNYKLERATTTTYPTQTTGDFSPVPGTLSAVGGRYTVIDTPAIRQSYVYRLTATVNNVAVVSYEILNTDPFSAAVLGQYDSSTGQYQPYSVVQSTTTAYATEIRFTTGSDYTKDITADIYRAEVPASTSVSTGSFTASAVEQAAFTKLTTTAAHPVDEGSYLDSGLTIGAKYIYRVEYKAGGKTFYYSDTTVRGYTGYVQTPSVPYSSTSSIYNVGTPSGGSPSVTRQYYTITGSAIKNARIISQSRTQTPSSDWGTYTGGISTTVASYIPAAGTTDNLKWEAQDTGVTPNSEYFYFVTPTAVANTQFRLVLVNGTDPQNYTVLINF
jgi:hypothetical protein